jgi:hypothetical protein
MHNDYDAIAAGYSADNESNATNALRAMTEAFRTSGFSLDIVSEPEPVPAAASPFPDAYADLRANPRFLFFRLIAPFAP